MFLLVLLLTCIPFSFLSLSLCILLFAPIVINISGHLLLIAEELRNLEKFVLRQLLMAASVTWKNLFCASFSWQLVTWKNIAPASCSRACNLGQPCASLIGERLHGSFCNLEKLLLLQCGVAGRSVSSPDLFFINNPQMFYWHPEKTSYSLF